MTHKILIVDDAPDWREMLAGLLQDIYADLEVNTAGSIDEAKAILARQAFDLALIDIRLDDSDEGNTDGLTLMRYIHQHYAQTRMMIITGYANLETVKQAMHPDQAGLRPVVDYIEKDRLQMELLPRLTSLLQSP